MLPEMKELIRRDSSTAGTLAHAESTYVAEIAQECALQESKNIVVDGSLRNWKWYKKVLTSLRRERPHYRIAIIKVTCKRETMLARAAARGRVTGRTPPRKLLDDSFDAVDESVKNLSPLCDLVFEIDTETDDPVITSITVRSDRQLAATIDFLQPPLPHLPLPHTAVVVKHHNHHHHQHHIARTHVATICRHLSMLLPPQPLTCPRHDHLH
jgi:hypothetical protein